MIKLSGLFALALAIGLAPFGPIGLAVLVNTSCDGDNAAIDPATIYTRAAAQHHTDSVGVRIPGRWFTGTLHANAITIQYGGEERKWIITTMADKRVAQRILPITLKALGRLPIDDGLARIGASVRGLNGSDAGGRMLSSMLVVMTWDYDAQRACQDEQEKGYGHACVQDKVHDLHRVATTNMSAFHSPEFNALGFAKIKYLYDALSLGYDVLAMDADVLVLQSPFPIVLPLRPQLAALTEKCELVDPAMQMQIAEVRKPAQNIGVLFARSDGPTMRCVERWFGSMYAKVDNIWLWDQEEFNKIIAHCAARVNMRLHCLDNRRFVSMCHPQCGCQYPDSEHQLLLDPANKRRHIEWTLRTGAPYDNATTRTCGPSAWANWTMVHFPCQGSLQDKELYMGELFEGYMKGESRVIKNLDKVP